MKKLLVCIAILPTIAFCLANPPIVEAPISRMALFKNGTVFVTRRITPPATQQGPFLITDTIEPAHGTLWHSSSAPLRIRTVQHQTSSAATDLLANPTTTYLGHRVTLHINTGNGIQKISGVVTNAATNQPKAPDPQQNMYASFPYNTIRPLSLHPTSPGLTLVLDSGQLFTVQTSKIDAILADGYNLQSTVNTPAWQIEQADEPFDIHYVSHGATWAPAYRIDLIDSSTLDLSMSAVIRNEIAPIQNTSIQLISGFPQIEFADKPGLLFPSMSLKTFFDGLARSSRSPNSRITTQVTLGNDQTTPFDTSLFHTYQTGMPEGSDIHYRDIGLLTMGKNESLYISLEKQKTGYEQLIEWDIPPLRNNSGSLHRDMASINDLWNVIHFKNPFQNPLTTAPVEVTQNGQLLCQDLMKWANPGQPTRVKTTKALGAAGHIRESIAAPPATPLTLRFNNHTYTQQIIEGGLIVNNYYPETKTISIHLQLHGAFIQATHTPEGQRTISQDFSSPNALQEIHWLIPVAPNEEINLAYTYTFYFR